MQQEQDSIFASSLLAGVFIGFFDTIFCLAYNIGYRNATGYLPSFLINVSSIIFAVNIIFVFIGMTYGLFLRMFGRNDIVYHITFIAITAFLVWRTELGHRFTNAVVNHEYKGLMLGIVVLLGIGAISVPLLYRSRFLGKYVI